MTGKTLWYLADPMCSWCWGFAPVIDMIRDDYSDQLSTELLLGGLRPGTKLPMEPSQREEILNHWHAVHRKTGQLFLFEGAMPPGFIYDTEPASRAIVSTSLINPSVTFSLLKAIQSAFYLDQSDVTKTEVLSSLASTVGINSHQFIPLFESDEMRSQTLAQFNKSREFGVHGFPSLILQDEGGYSPLSSGYATMDQLRPKIDALLARS
ncbi:MAG: DsbA family protein [Nitrosomonadaceae bacterium]|nr:DsbA family protein [Nitrosomonadaceae bacterium]